MYHGLARRARPAGGALAAGDALLAAGDALLAAGDAARESMSILKAAGSARAWGELGALGVAHAASAAEGATRERHCGQEGSCLGVGVGVGVGGRPGLGLGLW